MGDSALEPPGICVSILIVSYNTRDMTCACIRSVYEQAQNCRFEVIVVDNASSDGSADAIAAEFPQAKLIHSDENLGFARANNLAAKYARSDFLLLLNPDTLVLDHAVDRLVAFARKRPDAGIWGGRTVFADGSLNPTSCWRFMTLWSLFAGAIGLAKLGKNGELLNPEGYGGWQRNSVREVEIVTGCFLLATRDLWERLDGFDEAFFMYAEEADLCYRARKLGARGLFTPDATIIHYGGGTQVAGAKKIELLLTGKTRYIRKHFSPIGAFVAVAFLKLHVMVRVVGFRLAQVFTRSSRHAHSALEWQKVWKHRDRW